MNIEVSIVAVAILLLAVLAYGKPQARAFQGKVVITIRNTAGYLPIE